MVMMMMVMMSQDAHSSRLGPIHARLLHRLQTALASCHRHHLRQGMTRAIHLVATLLLLLLASIAHGSRAHQGQGGDDDNGASSARQNDYSHRDRHLCTLQRLESELDAQEIPGEGNSMGRVNAATTSLLKAQCRAMSCPGYPRVMLYLKHSPCA